MKKKAIALLGVCLALPVAATARDFSYDYIEGLYISTEYEDNSVFGESLSDAESEGGFINLGLSITPRIYSKLGVGYAAVEDSGIDIAAVTGVVGTHFPLADCFDFYVGAQAAWGRASDLKFPPPNVADNRDDVDGYGLGAEFGVRSWLADAFEVEVNGTYTNLFAGEIDDVSSDTDDFTATLSARVYPTRQFSIGAGYSYAFGNEIKSWMLGVRYDFCCY